MLVLVVCGYVAIPLFANRQKAVDNGADDNFHRQQLIRETIHDLEFDFQTGKLSQVDYEILIAEREQAIQKADSVIGKTIGMKMADILKKLEAEIQKAKGELEPSMELVCPQCGHQHNQGDKFCSKCGSKL